MLEWNILFLCRQIDVSDDFETLPGWMLMEILTHSSNDISSRQPAGDLYIEIWPVWWHQHEDSNCRPVDSCLTCSREVCETVCWVVTWSTITTGRYHDTKSDGYCHQRNEGTEVTRCSSLSSRSLEVLQNLPTHQITQSPQQSTLSTPPIHRLIFPAFVNFISLCDYATISQSFY